MIADAMTETRHPTARKIGVRALAAALAVLLGLVAWHLLLEGSHHWDYNAIRLERSFVLAEGVSIYPGPDSGPILNTIYGPLGAVAYLPATLWRTPGAAVLGGQVLALVFFLGVPLWIHARPGRRGVPWPAATFAFLTFAALTVDLRPLSYVAFNVHVDAPALALGLGGWAVLVEGRRLGRFRLPLAALLVALAVWTKLMTLPLLAALPLWVGLREGHRRALAASAWVGAALAVVSGVLVLVFGPADDLFLNMWTVPSLHTTGRALTPEVWARAIGAMAREAGSAWLLAVLTWVLAVALRVPSAARPLADYGLAALALLPISLLGVVKDGGDVNALSYAVTFVVCGTTLTLARTARRRRAMRWGQAALPALVVVLVVAVGEPGSLTSWRRPPELDRTPQEIAYHYALAHPRRMYFPRLTLSSLLAEGEVYHQSVGLLDRRLAGLEPSRQHLLAHLPRDLEGIALYQNAFQVDIDLVDLPEFACPEDDPELPGFVVYRRCGANR